MASEVKLLNILIARPLKKAQSLATSLSNMGLESICQPMFDYQPFADFPTSKSLLTNNNIVIFVSASAVEYANKIFAAKNWRYQHIIAVGAATKKALEALEQHNVISPVQENSEGLLALPQLSKRFSGELITIVRGDSGREHLATQLTKQGANVTYLESYQCVWRTFPEGMGKQWLKQQINCIVVTSNAILEKLIQLTLDQHKQNEDQLEQDFWQHQCLWIVASQRIADRAEQFGLTQVIISDGASEKAIITTLKQLTDR